MLSSVAQSIAPLTSEQLNSYAWELRKEFPDSTIYYALKAQTKAKVEGDKHQELRAYNIMGIAYNYKGEYLESLEQHLKAKDFALVLNDSLEYAHALNSIGRLYYTQGDYIKSYEMYFNALGIFLSIDNQLGAAYCYNSLSELYVAQNNLIKAEEMVRKTLNIRTSLNDEKGQISGLIKLAEIQKRNKSYIDSYESYLKAEKIALSGNSEAELAEIKLGIADLYLQQKNHSRGLVYAKDAYELTYEKNNIDLVSDIEIALGKLYFLAGDYQKSEKYLTKVLQFVEKSSDLELKTDAYLYLSKIKENQSKVKEAYNLFKLYNEAKQTLDNSNKARIIERLEGKVEIEKRERENEMLRIKQISDQAQLDQQYIVSIATTLGFVLTSLLFIIMYVSSRRKKKDNAKLVYQNIQIANQNDSLAELNREKDMLMNIVAHDLQSPINNIKSLIGIISTEGTLSNEQKMYAEKIDEMSNAGKELIQDLLYVNDFESNTHKLNESIITVDDFIEKTVEVYRTQANSKQIALRFDLNSDGHNLKTDKSYLQRILDNLISNAIKFSPRGKSVFINTSVSKNNQLVLKIADEGQGFSEADKQNIYKKFKKLSARPTGGESSNGLGLAIVKILCGRLGIKISLNSELGKGSEFVLTFKPISS